MTPADYPRRSGYFANRFCRLMTKVCLANEVGPEVVTLLMTIAMLEDSKKYRGAVNFWDHQLVPLVGVSDRFALHRIRKKAVNAGWLYYIPGRKESPGYYWVTIPVRYDGMDDGPIDEDFTEYADPVGGIERSLVCGSCGADAQHPHRNRTASAPEPHSIRTGTAQHPHTSLPNPLPKPLNTHTAGSEAGVRDPEQPVSMPVPGTPAAQRDHVQGDCGSPPENVAPGATGAISPPSKQPPWMAGQVDDSAVNEVVAVWNSEATLPAAQKRQLGAAAKVKITAMYHDEVWGLNWRAAIANAAVNEFWAGGVGRVAGRLTLSQFVSSETERQKILDYVPGTARPNAGGNDLRSRAERQTDYIAEQAASIYEGRDQGGQKDG